MEPIKPTIDLEKVAFAVFCGLLFLLPLAFFPLNVDWFDLPKEILLATGALLVTCLWLGKGVLAGKLAFIKSGFLLPAFALAAVSAISALLSDNKVFSLSFDPVVFAGCALVLLVGTQLIRQEKDLHRVIKTLLLCAVMVSLFTLAQNVVTVATQLAKSAQPLVFLSPTFSPTGSPLATGIFLALLLPLAIGFCLERKSEVNLIFPVIMTIGLAAIIYSLSKNPPILLPQEAGWRIATNTLGQTPASAFFGAGPGNFIDAFTLGKPLEFNATRFWNLRFTTSSNWYFYLLTTLGIAGLAAFLFLAWKLIQTTKTRLKSGVVKGVEKGLLVSLLLGLVLFALFPAPTVVLVTFFSLLALLTGHYFLIQSSYIAQSPSLFANNNWLRPLSLIVTLALLAGTIYHLGRFALADYYFSQSLQAAARNRGTDTYNLQIKAISLNPWSDGYRVSYSQTNLALADALAAQPNLTDQQKQTVVALVQQAIRESRLAAALSPKRAADFENLSLVYRNLINFAQGSDQWTIASQNQAISLDPTNPRLRLDLGGIYFALKDYQSAAQSFALAANLKPDFANAHYNLAQVLRQLNLKDQASQQLQLTVTLVCASGQNVDCQKVQAEIAGLTASATPSANLATPSAEPTNLPKAKTKPPAKISSPSGELAP